jgi:hypothetical protein
VTGKSYGLATVCRVWRLARSDVYRRLSPTPAAPPQRRGPTGAITDAALTAAIRAVLAASPFHGEGHRKVWARLRHAGTRTSLRRVLRLMRENDLLAPSRVGSARGPRAHDGTITPETVDTMWGIDLTATFTGEGQAAVFIAVDHCSAECVGIIRRIWRAGTHERATRLFDAWRRGLSSMAVEVFAAAKRMVDQVASILFVPGYELAPLPASPFALPVDKVVLDGKDSPQRLADKILASVTIETPPPAHALRPRPAPAARAEGARSADALEGGRPVVLTPSDEEMARVAGAWSALSALAPTSGGKTALPDFRVPLTRWQ